MKNNKVKKVIASISLAIAITIIGPASVTNTFVYAADNTCYSGRYLPGYAPRCSAKYKSIVDGLKSVGIDSSYSNRKYIAQCNGIYDYRGTASQNTYLLSLLKSGRLFLS